MEWLNYHHLLYFWVVAREGSIARATEELNLTQPTISAQLRALEESMGEKLFAKAGRGLTLTPAGHVAFRYADEIFSLGRELRDTLKGRPTGKPARLVVGLVDVVPKLIAYRLLEPALDLAEPMDVSFREDRHDRLFAALAVHELDMVVSDSPIPPGSAVRAYNHLLGESGISLFAIHKLAQRHHKNFPRSLEGAPMLLPARNSELRRALSQWLERIDVRPDVVADFEDSALMKIFGHAGRGIFPGPTAIEKEIASQYGVQVVGRVPEIKERFFVITPERKIKHPAVAAITEMARTELFG